MAAVTGEHDVVQPQAALAPATCCTPGVRPGDLVSFGTVTFVLAASPAAAR